MPNPHPRIELPTGHLAETLPTLATDDLVGYLRFTHWQVRHDGSGHSRWWWSKLFSTARRELVARGRAADAWQEDRQPG